MAMLHASKPSVRFPPFHAMGRRLFDHLHGTSAWCAILLEILVYQRWYKHSHRPKIIYARFSDERAICTKFLLCHYRLLFTINSLQLPHAVGCWCCYPFYICVRTFSSRSIGSFIRSYSVGSFSVISKFAVRNSFGRRPLLAIAVPFVHFARHN